MISCTHPPGCESCTWCGFNIKTHPIELTTTKPSRELGRQLMGLRYDLLVEVLDGMRLECQRQVRSDRMRNRMKLARHLDSMDHAFDWMRHDLEQVIRICQPYIDQEKNNEVRSPELRATGSADNTEEPAGEVPEDHRLDGSAV